MNRSTTLFAAAGVAALALVGLAARADSLFPFARSAQTPAEAEALHDRMLAKAAFTAVLEHKNETLGMIAPQDLPAYAPIYPDGLILGFAPAPDAPSGETLNYDAAAPLRAVFDFYADAAALAHLPLKTATVSDQGGTLTASDGRRKLTVKLTRQFAQSTVVDMTYL
jgi:hypothetical protein